MGALFFEDVFCAVGLIIAFGMNRDEDAAFLLLFLHNAWLRTQGCLNRPRLQ